jgi:hypothetical protein
LWHPTPIGHVLGKARSKPKAKSGFVGGKKRFQLCFVGLTWFSERSAEELGGQ